MESITPTKPIQNRITQLFDKKPSQLLSVFYTAGFPQLDDTVRIASFLERAGADLIEIGIPFSDPVADGPTIQESNSIALANGMNVKRLLQQVKAIRAQVSLPIILMGYLNPLMQYGMKKFSEDAAASGVDGVILPDLPLAEFKEEYQALFDVHHLSSTFLISPTTSTARIKEIDQATHGFIYAVSATSTTGARDSFDQSQINYFERLQNLKLKNPFLIGFGVSNRQTFQTAAKYGAGAIVGSAFIKMLEGSSDFERDIQSFVAALKTTT